MQHACEGVDWQRQVELRPAEKRKRDTRRRGVAGHELPRACPLKIIRDSGLTGKQSRFLLTAGFETPDISAISGGA